MIDTIIDLSHYIASADLEQAKAPGIGGGIIAVIHKATQGSGFVDPQFAGRRQKAYNLGLLWGAYHFGTGDDVMDQVDHFLNTVEPLRGDLVALDFEPNPGGLSMTLAQARQFVTIIKAELGRYPFLYGGYTIRETIGSAPDPVLAQCPLWYARYSSQPFGIPYQVWPSGYTLWQFTDGAWGAPAPVAGIGECDRNRFIGSEADLRTLWPF